MNFVKFYAGNKLKFTILGYADMTLIAHLDEYIQKWMTNEYDIENCMNPEWAFDRSCSISQN